MNETAAATDTPPEDTPWIDPLLQQQIEWRDGDVVVSVPIKSGTTWMMSIVHQLRSGGDPDFVDVYAEVPRSASSSPAAARGPDR